MRFSGDCANRLLTGGHERAAALAATGRRTDLDARAPGFVVPKSGELPRIPLTTRLQCLTTPGGSLPPGVCRREAMSSSLIIVPAGVVALVAAFLLLYEVWIRATDYRVTHRRRKPVRPSPSPWGSTAARGGDERKASPRRIPGRPARRLPRSAAGRALRGDSDRVPRRMTEQSNEQSSPLQEYQKRL